MTSWVVEFVSSLLGDGGSKPIPSDLEVPTASATYRQHTPCRVGCWGGESLPGSEGACNYVTPQQDGNMGCLEKHSTTWELHRAMLYEHGFPREVQQQYDKQINMSTKYNKSSSTKVEHSQVYYNANLVRDYQR